MAYTFAYGGDVTNFPNFGFPGTYMYTPYGVGFPAGHASSTGGFPVKVYGIGSDYLDGAGHTQVIFAGASVGGGTVVSSTGGGFEHRIWCDSGTVTYGRNENDNELNVFWSGGGVEWPGASLPGWFEWATVALAPAMLDAIPQSAPGSIRVRFNGNGNTGGQPMVGWQLQYSTAPSMAGAVTIASSGTSDLLLDPARTYYFRSRGLNDVGWSAWSGILAGTTRAAGGKRWNGSAFVNNSTSRRWNGSAFVDLSTGKRWNGSAWGDLT